MTSLRHSIGHPVITRSTAEQLGAVRAVVVDVTTRRISSVCLGGNRRKARLVSWQDVTSFGDDAVIVAQPDVAREPNGPAEQHAVRGEIALLDQRVLTTVGDELGTIVDIDLDVDDGTLRTLLVGETRIGAERLRGIGTYAIVVDPSADG